MCSMSIWAFEHRARDQRKWFLSPIAGPYSRVADETGSVLLSFFHGFRHLLGSGTPVL